MFFFSLFLVLPVSLSCLVKRAVKHFVTTCMKSGIYCQYISTGLLVFPQKLQKIVVSISFFPAGYLSIVSISFLHFSSWAYLTATFYLIFAGRFSLVCSFLSCTWWKELLSGKMDVQIKWLSRRAERWSWDICDVFLRVHTCTHTAVKTSQGIKAPLPLF